MPRAARRRFRLGAQLWLILAVFVVFVATFFAYVHSEKQIDRANEQRHRSLILADELRQSSDDLTRMVRTYVATGDPIYKRHYQEILDIRDGSKPRPVDYQGIYWDLVMADDRRPRPSGEAIPLLSLMRQAGFSDDEFASLRAAKFNSDALTRTEFAAMALLESTTPPRESNRQQAIGMLHDHAYHQAKAAIMGPIGEFYEGADRRTLEAVRSAEARALQVRLALLLIGVLLIFLVVSVRRRQHEILGGSIDAVYAGIARLGKGELSLPIEPARGTEDSVLGWLAEAQAKLAGLDAERRQSEHELHKLNRALRLLSDCNLSLVSAGEEATLLGDVCRLIVETGGYRMVWVGVAEPDAGRTVRPVACHGHGADEYLASVRVSWDAAVELGQSPTGLAIATGSTQINQDYRDNPGMDPWRAAAGRQGYRASIGLPLRVAGRTIGALTLYAGEANAFDGQEVRLLEELARNLGFGIETLRTRDQRAAAEAASRAKSRFLANMSHELRTPMNAIMGMTSLALRRATEPQLRDQLGKIAQASKHLLQVINDILDISKIEADCLVLEKVDFRLGAVIENLVNLIGHKATEAGLRLRFDIPPGIAGKVFAGDPLRLGQILVNLAGNAVKFTRAGSITLRIEVVGETADDIVLRFAVADTGIGIAVEDQERLFTAFEQADGSMTRKYGGTGLGLAISKRLTHLMGGEIGVDSRLGEGSTFWFTARFGKVAETAAPAVPRDTAETRLKSGFAGARILLVEDEPVNQEVARGLLEDVGLAVDLADDGVAALTMARRTSYDLILMDMQMPKLNGVDATRMIRALDGYAAVPILAMTANAFDDDRRSCLDAGMNGHIGKPVDPGVLYATLLHWLAQSRR